MSSNLQNLLRDAFLNNTYDYESMDKELNKTWKNSYSYLYTLQKDYIEYEELFYFSNDVENRNSKELGHLYLSASGKACFDVDYNFIHVVDREEYYRSKYFQKPVSLETVAKNKSIFKKIPVIIIDNQVIWDCEITPRNETFTVVLPFKKDFLIEKQLKEERKWVRCASDSNGAKLVVSDSLTELSDPLAFDPEKMIKLADAQALDQSTYIATQLLPNYYISIYDEATERRKEYLIVTDDYEDTHPRETTPHFNQGKMVHISDVLANLAADLPTISEGDYVKLTNDIKYIPHNLQVLIIDNCYYNRISTNKSYIYSSIYQTISFTKEQVGRDLTNITGTLFCSIHYPVAGGGGYELGTSLIPLTYNDTTGKYEATLPSVLNRQIHSYNREFYVSFIYVSRLKAHEFYFGGNETVVTNGKANVIVPQKSELLPYEMPIPVENFMIFKTSELIDGYQLVKNTQTLDLHYPNIYTFKEDALDEGETFKVFYFYHTAEDLKYTVLFDFYYHYLTIAFSDYSLEEIIDKIYNGTMDLSRYVPEIREEFVSTFQKIIDYKYYIHKYGEQDFLLRYLPLEANVGKAPIEYKDETLKDWIKVEPHVLREYVLEQKKLGDTLGLFTNTIDLDSRYRTSSYYEVVRPYKAATPNGSAQGADFPAADGSVTPNEEGWFDYYERCSPKVVGALKVVTDDLGDSYYDPNIMIYISKVVADIPDIQLGEFVVYRLRSVEKEVLGIATEYFPEGRYVFSISNTRPYPELLDLSVFVDGIYVTNLYHDRYLYTDYIYIPADMVTADSYIEIQSYPYYKYEKELSLNSMDESVDIDLEPTEHIWPTISDVYFTLTDKPTVRLDEEYFDFIEHYQYDRVIGKSRTLRIVSDDYEAEHPQNVYDPEAFDPNRMITISEAKELFPDLVIPTILSKRVVKDDIEEDPYETYNPNINIKLTEARVTHPYCKIGDIITWDATTTMPTISTGHYINFSSDNAEENLKLVVSDDYETIHPQNGVQDPDAFNPDTMIKLSDAQAIIPEVEEHFYIEFVSDKHYPIDRGDHLIKTTSEDKPVKFTRIKHFTIKPNDELPLDYDLTFHISKNNIRLLVKVTENGYPSFVITNKDFKFSNEYIRIFRNGRLVPRGRYVFTSTYGRPKILFLDACQAGEYLVIEINPYRRNLVYYQEELTPGVLTINLKDYINKPFDIRYYDVYMNGRKLSINNVFSLTPWIITLVNLKSYYNLEIYEVERDYEWYGLDYNEYTYYYNLENLLGSQFIEELEKRELLLSLIEAAKDPHLTIQPNTNDEEKLDFEDMRNYAMLYVFYREELLPKTMYHPDYYQESQKIMLEQFEKVYNTYMRRPMDDADDRNTVDYGRKSVYPKVLLLDPDIYVRDNPEVSTEKQWVFPIGNLGNIDQYIDQHIGVYTPKLED